MTNEKIQLFQNNLLFIVQSDSGQTYSFRLDVRKLIQLLMAIVFTFILLFSGTLLYFQERKTNQLLVKRNTLNQIALAPITDSNVPLTEKNVSTSAKLQEVSTDCSSELCAFNLTLVAQDPSTPATGSLLILLEAEAPQIGGGNPHARGRKKFYAYPPQEVNANANLNDLLGLKSKPFTISHSLTSKAEFRIGKFVHPTFFHLYIFNDKNEIVKQETLTIEKEDKNDP